MSDAAEPARPPRVGRGGILLPFRLLGIPVRLDLSFLLVLPLFAYMIGSQLPEFTAQLRQLALLRDPELARRLVPAGDGSVAWLVGLVAALGLFASVVVHELGHAVVARLYGVPTLEIRLWFLGGVAQFKDIPRRRGAEALVALAGPATSLALAAALGLLLPVAPLGATATTVLAYLAATNVGLALFNLLPAIPLDGGRVLRSVLALAMPRLRATNVAVAVSGGIAVLLGVYGVVSGQLFLVVMAFFVYEAGRSEARAALMEDALAGLTAEDLMTPRPQAVEPDMALGQFVRLRHFGRHAGYPVVDAAGRLLGYAFLAEALAALDEPGAPGRRADAATATVADVMRPADVVRPGTTGVEVLAALANSELGRLCVVDPAGRLVGIVGKTDVIAALRRA
ncbi:MAG TPA: site-2 protease family protein [Trueperaceae bacterium]|mgnify:FL=1|nr:site-2 protease family protein [Trueperaceae bacterium]